ncbi:hypothetical protein KKA15_00845 [Patescibacteria group bacterium]|nr:hypothetical protein [Patescibacteria group bacterium]
MHHAVCDKCGKDCEVPFKPTGDKPIYCSDCFKNVEPKRSGGRDFQRSSFADKRMYKATCDKCHNECEVPFMPTRGKPVYCDNCFVREDKPNSRGGSPSNDQLAKINAKLDEILKALGTKVKPENKEVPAKEDKPKKSATKKTTTKKPVAKKSAKGGSASGRKVVKKKK